MQEPTYTLYPDGIEYASFGGNMRSREYVENWPFVETDGKKEVFALDGFLPYGLHSYFAEYLPTLGCVTVDDVEDKLTNSDKNGIELFWDISPSALGFGSEVKDFARFLHMCVDIGVPIEQILKMVDEAAVRADEETEIIRR